ncbi:glycosyltransferase [Pseudoalteromonas sp. NEC-BIFX-2020_015]|uniref:glycosyltransferase n=1 Tax=Pseudoalteromonas sp. NEC-BIFX-2020_015 TaxID=2729544 RepID=UPI0014615429|nr:glycosyltransferase [Pseudoalteromonas sp. NEC-BIFX-2020_015]NMR25428.1 glycosyltransferase [Pseudoalteromonas sp. NEC-BIFX-2020_015]
MITKYSIITPIYNAESYIETFIQHVNSFTKKFKHIEWIIVDDGSNDDTFQILKRAFSLPKNNDAVSCYQLEKNNGPGIARNKALENVKGEWVLFVDADDQLDSIGFEKLNEYITDNTDCDLISFSWANSNNKEVKIKSDSASLLKSKKEILCDYLSLKMDGSVIFSAIKSSLIKEHKIKFLSSFHEDVDFLFKCYWHCQQLTLFDEIIYIKSNRDASIINSISYKHIIGFIRAYEEMIHFLDSKGTLSTFKPELIQGALAIIATRIRNIDLLNKCSIEEVKKIIFELKMFGKKYIPVNFDYDSTQYHQLVHYIINKAQPKTKLQLREYFDKISDIANSLWSCKDLEDSLFLAPNQVRACCKRFFIGNEMKGDVVLIDNISDDISIQDIKQAKQQLKKSLNNGSKTDCDGCPYLEFKPWRKENLDRVKYLSLEHHSVCNLRCIYCDEKYYGGKKSSYDIKKALTSEQGLNYLKGCETIVWGGGEPSLGRDFDSLLPDLMNNSATTVQRLLSNSVKFSKTISNALKNANVKLVTSIDAGTAKTFSAVRGKNKLNDVLLNLTKYAEINAENITIKYILREDNSSVHEITSFINELISHPILQRCNYQISCDFKYDTLSTKVLSAAVLLYGLLIKNHYSTVFYDDLLRARLAKITKDNLTAVEQHLVLHGFYDFLASPSVKQDLIVWGIGWQTKYLLENSLFFNENKVAFFVVDKEYLTCDKYNDTPVYTPESILKSDLPVLISASQGYEKIQKRLSMYNIPEERIFKKAIL